jgi:hypothetical protein
MSLFWPDFGSSWRLKAPFYRVNWLISSLYVGAHCTRTCLDEKGGLCSVPLDSLYSSLENDVDATGFRNRIVLVFITEWLRQRGQAYHPTG